MSTSHQEAYADDLLGPLFLQQRLPAHGRRRSDDQELRGLRQRAATKSFRRASVRRHSLHPGDEGLFPDDHDLRRPTRRFRPLLNATFVFDPDQGKWNDLSPMASLDWQVNAGRRCSMLRVAKGFKSGGFNGRANTLARMRPNTSPRRSGPTKPASRRRIANQLTLERRRLQQRLQGLPGARSGSTPIGYRLPRRCCRCSTPASCGSTAPSSKRPGPRSTAC